MTCFAKRPQQSHPCSPPLLCSGPAHLSDRSTSLWCLLCLPASPPAPTLTPLFVLNGLVSLAMFFFLTTVPPLPAPIYLEQVIELSLILLFHQLPLTLTCSGLCLCHGQELLTMKSLTAPESQFNGLAPFFLFSVTAVLHLVLCDFLLEEFT